MSPINEWESKATKYGKNLFLYSIKNGKQTINESNKECEGPLWLIIGNKIKSKSGRMDMVNNSGKFNVVSVSFEATLPNR